MTELLAESYLHSLDPIAVRVFDLPIRWYGLAYVAGFILAWLFLRWMARTNRSPLTVRQVGDLMFYVIIGVLLGGRLGYAVFYAGGRPFIEFTDAIPYWELLAINRGGMSSHGGMIGVIGACWFFARRAQIPVLHLIDLGAIGCTAGFFFGRLANFVNAELPGRPIPASMQADAPWWSVKYPKEITDSWLRVTQLGDNAPPELVRDLVQRVAMDLNITAETPDALREAVEQEASSRLNIIEAQLRGVFESQTFYPDLIESANNSSRSAHEQVVQVIEPMLTAYYPSQVFQSLADGLFVAILLAIIWFKPRRPGVVGCWYLMIYGILRIVAEQFRQPDEGVALLLGLSRGQVLSAIMVLCGLFLLPVMARRDAPRLGGSVRPARVVEIDHENEVQHGATTRTVPDGAPGGHDPGRL